MIKRYFKSAIHKLFPKKEFEIYDHSILPAKHLRFNGPSFKDNAFYIQTAEAEARRAVSKLGCKPESRILEIGCGKGRFVTGLLRIVGRVNYTGVDIHWPSIKWCRRYIEKRESSYHFVHLDIASVRYNKNGNPIEKDFSFDIKDESIDIIYSWGVFANMAEDVLTVYMNDMKRLLAPNGKVFLTAFVEENVPDVSVNPEGYLNKDYSTPQKVVRYEKNHLFSIITNAGLQIDEFIYGQEFDTQSAFYLNCPPLL